MKKLHITVTFHERLWGFLYLGAELLLLPLILALSDQFFGLHLSDAELNFLYFTINFLCVTLIFHRFLRKNADLALKRVPAVLLTAGAGYVLCNIANIMLSVLVRMLYPSFHNANDSYIAQMVSDQYTMMFIGTVLFVPITEELLYRGLIFCGLYNKNKLLAYSISTLAFSVLHVYGYIGLYPPVVLLLCLLEYIPAGLFLGWAYAKTDTILTPILIHMLINSGAVLTMR